MASARQPSRTSVLKGVAKIGVDLTKTSVHFVGLDASGQVLTRCRYSKGNFAEITLKMEPYQIGVEACCATVTWDSSCSPRGTTCG